MGSNPIQVAIFFLSIAFLLGRTNAFVAQLVEQRTENPRVAGSIPALGIFVAKSNEIIEYGRVAQLVEHLTFNQVVRGSNPRTLMNEEQRRLKYSKGFRCFLAIFKVADFGELEWL